MYSKGLGPREQELMKEQGKRPKEEEISEWPEGLKTHTGGLLSPRSPSHLMPDSVWVPVFLCVVSLMELGGGQDPPPHHLPHQTSGLREGM